MLPPLALPVSHAAVLINSLLCVSYCVTDRQLHNSPIYVEVYFGTLSCSTSCPEQAKPAAGGMHFCLMCIVFDDNRSGILLIDDEKAK